MKKNNFWFGAGLVIGIVLTLVISRPCHNKQVEISTVYCDTIVDTIKYYPEIYDSVTIRYVTKTFPIRKDTIIYNSIYADTLKKDSEEVIIPITQKHYSDSTYEAWVSGFEPSLDSIKLYQSTITNTIYKKEKDKRFSIGVTTGYGVTKEGLSPYIGIGVTYSIFKF